MDSFRIDLLWGVGLAAGTGIIACKLGDFMFLITLLPVVRPLAEYILGAAYYTVR